MKKYIEIDGISFEVKKRLNIIQGYELKTLYDCYNNPSMIKQDIMKYWVDFAIKHNSGVYFGVAGYNCMMFTFDAMIMHEDKKYYIHITPKNNYIMEVI